MEHEQRNTPSVIPSSEIPLSSAPEHEGLEVRPFLGHRILGAMMPRSEVALSWTHARPGQQVRLRSHPTSSLLIVLQGKASLIGADKCIEQGDVITVPSDHEYGFTSIGENGLQVLQVAFDRAEAPPPGASLDELLARNEGRGQIILNNPFFHLLRMRHLETPAKKKMLVECLRVFADAFQTLLLTRQATCRDEDYHDAFGEHLLEELGHNKLLKVTRDPRADSDPILRATSTWFCHRMLVLDNAGKAVVNLVLETAGYYLGTLAAPLFSGEDCVTYFDTHAEGDELHKEVGVRLLENQHPETYRRLMRVLDDSWDMLDAMTTRFAAIVEAEGRAS